MRELNFRHKTIMQNCGVCKYCLYENDMDCYYKSCKEGVEERIKIVQKTKGLKICIDDSVEGIRKGKIYNVEHVFLREGEIFYELVDDYGIWNIFRAKRFMDYK